MAAPQMQIRIAANLAELKRNLAEGKSSIETTTAAMQKLAASFDGSRIIQAAHNVTAAVSQVGGASKLTEAEQRRVNATLDKAIEKYRAMGREAPPAILALHKATQQTEKSTGLLSGTIGKLASAFAIGSLIDRVVTSVFSLGREAFDTAGKIVDLSQKTGLSMKAVQQYGYVATQTGGSMEQFTDTIFKLGVTLEQGGDKQRKAVAELGLGYERIRALKPEQQFDQIMRALSGVESVTQRNRIGVELMGKAYANVAAAVGDYNNLMLQAPAASDAAVLAVDAAADAMNRAWETAKSGAINAIGGIVLAWEEGRRQMSGAGVSVASSMGTFTGSALGMGARAGAFLRDQNNLTLPQVGSPNAQVGNLGPLAVPAGALKNIVGINKDAQAVADALQKRLDALTGAATRAKIAQLAKEVELAGKLSSDAFQDLGKQLQAMADDGYELPAVLEGIRVATERLTFAQRFGIGAATDYVATIQRISKLPLSVGDMTAALNSKVTGFDPSKLPGQNVNYAGQSLPPTKMQDFGQRMGSTIAQTAIGGGNVGQAVGSQIGLELGKKLASKAGATLSNLFGKTIGGAMTAAIPGLGALLGPLAGKLTGAIVGMFTGGEGAKANDLRDSLKASIANSMKGLENDTTLQAAFARFNRAGTQANVQAAADEIAARLEQIRQRTEAVTERFGRLESAVEQFGGVVPSSLRPVVEELRGMAGLTDEMRARLDALAGAPSWQSMEEAAERLGVDLASLGDHFKQSKLNDLALSFVRDLKLLEDGGADMNAVLAQSADKIGEMVRGAMEGGLKLPESLRPYIEKMIELGKLTGPNGDLVSNIDQLSFEDIEDTVLEGIKELLEDIRDLLQNDIPGAAAAAQRAFDNTRLPDAPGGYGGGAGADGWSGENPQYAHRGALVLANGIRKFHRGGANILPFPRLQRDEFPAILQSGESVLSRQATASIGAGAIGALNGGASMGGGYAPSSGRVVVENVIVIDGEVVARVAARNLPAALERLGVAI